MSHLIMAHRTIDLSGVVWRKSTRSSGSGNACVEVAQNRDGTVAIRDSKHPEHGILLVSAESWCSLVAVLKSA